MTKTTKNNTQQAFSAPETQIDIRSGAEMIRPYFLINYLYNSFLINGRVFDSFMVESSERSCSPAAEIICNMN